MNDTIEFPPLNTIVTDQETLMFLQSLTFYVKPKVVVESGTFWGHFVFAAFAGYRFSRIYTADPFPHKHIFEEYLEKNKEPMKNAQIYRHLGDLPSLLEEYEELRGHINLAFIDSGPPCADQPSNEGVESDAEAFSDHNRRWKDYKLIKPYMTHQGLIISHDANQAGWPGSKEIMDESILLNGGRGITIHQVRHTSP